MSDCFSNNGLVWTDSIIKQVQIDSISAQDAITCIRYTDTLVYEVRKDTIQKVGKVRMTQPYSLRTGFDLTFGKEKNGRQRTIALSRGNATLKFRFRNTSDYALNVYVTLKDSLGKIINANGTRPFTEGYYDWWIFYDVQPGQELPVEIDFSLNAYEWQYGFGPNCGRFTGLGKDFSFNMKLVSALQIGISNYVNAAETDAYKPYRILNATSIISEVLIGKEVIATSNEGNDVFSSLFVFPNPVKEKVQFSEPLENVSLIDVTGKVLYHADVANEINMQELPKGIYVLRTSSLKKPVKVMVE